jgi:HD-GYP domain-containing protein (c-di-GMP phosphodiesterase class II)
MKTIKVEDLQNGMSFTEPAYIDGEDLFVPPNIQIRQKDIDRLKKWGIDAVETEGEVIKAKIETAENKSKETPDIVDEIINAQADTELLNRYNKAVENLDVIYGNIKDNEIVDTEDIDSIENELMPMIKENKDDIIGFIILRGRGHTGYAKSSVNCMILSALVAEQIKMPNHKINQLGIAALLHDIGMMKIPDSIINKDGQLTESELNIMRTHPIHSYKIITKTLKYPEEIGRIALHHHERWDGKGYPKQLSGKNIMVQSRILSVTDAFEAMVSVRPYRNSMIGYKAMRQLLNDNSRRFDSEILKIFIKTMGIYPIGSIVLLNDASIGRVISTHSDAPLRPTVQLIVNANGGKCVNDSIIIDLLEEKKLFITRAINPQEIGT